MTFVKLGLRTVRPILQRYLRAPRDYFLELNFAQLHIYFRDL